MPAKAGISPPYRWRLALIALMCLGFGGWSLYDGLVRYPEHNRKVERFQEINKKYPDNWRDEWEKEAAARGWSNEPPGSPHSFSSLVTQFIYAGLTLPIGLFFGISFISSFNRWIATDENGLSTSKGQQAPFNSIKSLNKQRWRTKGIAVVHYQNPTGEHKIVLDDWKYEQQATKTMLQEVESRLQPEQIVGGTPLDPTTPAT